ncbi:uncharacterized protein HaLaN_23358 [Haematococcus lacustris]|uniref:Uncharacterized protein n=1 Tax=Haematococcus lacustris TaxID=44745 RepID=A0A699ZTX3_HAELA|nr:uncharacterized protein HaLaN_23358 [Haematococcus lacustris]
MHPQVLGRFLAYLARQQAIVDGGGEGSTTGLVGQQPGGGSTTGLVGQQPGEGSTTDLVGQQPGGGSTIGYLAAPETGANHNTSHCFSHVWSDKRASLILGRMWIMAYIYFNKRVLERKPKTLSDADWEEYERWMRKTPQDQS